MMFRIIIWKFTLDDKFLVKTASSANDNQIPPILKLEFFKYSS